MRSMHLNAYPEKLGNILKQVFEFLRKLKGPWILWNKLQVETSRDERKQAELGKAFDEKSKISNFNPH